VRQGRTIDPNEGVESAAPRAEEPWEDAPTTGRTMTRIRTLCPTCGEVDLRPHDISLYVIGRDADDVREGSEYRFDCPDCGQDVIKPADGRVVRLLTTGGVAAEYFPAADVATEVARARQELSHPEGMAWGPAFTTDDLLDFHLLLQTDDWFDTLRALTP
jgi:predicted RNA-binding Zn-ribbon protein involved in translation (DUF1610 family)